MTNHASPPPLSDADTDALLADATVAARRAGEILRAMFRTRPPGREKTSARDLVTDADLAAEREVLTYIEGRYPAHGWQSEEAGRQPKPSPFLWVVDPLDGTSNFAHGFPHFCVSVGLLYGGWAILGAIYDPMRDELFAGRIGGGVTCNGEPVSVSSVATLGRAMITTGFPYEPPEQRRAAADLTARVIERVQMMRRSGSAALDLAYVAAGRLDAHWEFGLSLHDFAAGVRLVAEGGGRVDDLSLPGWRPGVIASNGSPIHDDVIALHHQYLGPVVTGTSHLLA